MLLVIITNNCCQEGHFKIIFLSELNISFTITSTFSMFHRQSITRLYLQIWSTIYLRSHFQCLKGSLSRELFKICQCGFYLQILKNGDNFYDTRVCYLLFARNLVLAVVVFTTLIMPGTVLYYMSWMSEYSQFLRVGELLEGFQDVVFLPS